MIAALVAGAPAGAQQGADPDASPGGVIPVPYIVPRTPTVEPVSTADLKRLKRSYVKQKAAERDSLMVLANALPVVPSTPTTLTASAAFVTRPAAYTAPSRVAGAAPLGNMGDAGGDNVPDTTATAADSTGEYFIIRPILRGTHLRPITVNRVVGLATEYARRSLEVKYIIVVEAAPNDDDATDALLSEADAFRKRLINAGVNEQRVVVRDAVPTGSKSSIRILLRGPSALPL
ncbi:MAG: hypothetical protein ACR2M1_07670 [Gemmatimonadaceae bacterium]